MKFILVLLMSLAPLVSGAATLEFDKETSTYKGFVKVRTNKELYVEYTPAAEKKPTVVLLNGLTYSTRQFDSLAESLSQHGVGVLRFDFDGMGQTLLKYGPSSVPYPVKRQISDLHTLLKELKIKAPYNLAGLSYGGGVGLGFALTYPELVNNLILMAPYTQPLEGQDDWIRAQIWATRKIFPYNTYSDDELYDYFLRQIVWATYPQAEPIVLENPWKLDAIYNIVRGIRKFRPVDLADQLPEGTIHLMVAGRDQYIPKRIMDEFWEALLPEARMSRLLIKHVEHKMNEAVPNFTAAWIVEILKGNKLLFEGRDFEGNPYTGEVKSGSKTIRIERE